MLVRLKGLHKLSRGLSIGGMLWCLAVGCWIWVTPVRYLQYSSAEPEPRFVFRSFSEVSGLGIGPLIFPVFLSAIGAWAAWRHRGALLFLVTFVLLAFCVVSGFSIGLAYVPAGAALLWAALANLDGQSVEPPGT
jgi:hypothetical protein